MDVVDGKIVSWASRAGISSDELQPSRGLTVEGMHAAYAVDWGAAPSWSSFHGPANSLGLEPSAARWNKWPSVEKLHHVGGFPHEYSGRQRHRLGWGGVKPRHFHLGPKPDPRPETDLDQMLAMFEAQITGPAGHDSCATSSLGLENPTEALLEHSKECSTLQRSESDIPMGISSDLKRKRLEADISDEEERGWRRPLKLLLRKGLSMSDVGELGRIIIPKKSAETQFQRILDMKEGIMLEMHDYNGLKRWLFRFKWWINNKSRMYVLENTGEFIKYHGLKQHDIFIVYEDFSKKTVVRGHKGTDRDFLFDDLQDTNVAVQRSQSPPKRKDLTDPPCGILQNCHGHVSQLPA